MNHDKTARACAGRFSSFFIGVIGIGDVNGFVKCAVLFLVVEDISAFRRTLVTFSLFMPFRIRTEYNVILF